MTGVTESGGAMTVYLVPDYVPGKVFMGVKASVPQTKRQYNISAIPLTPEEARLLAEWLNSAATFAEQATAIK